MPFRIARWVVPALFVASVLATLFSPAMAMAETGSQIVTKTGRQGRWHIAETKNFYVCSDESASHARRLAEEAEAQRAALQRLWFGTESDEAWSPRCHLVLHSTPQSYVAAVGRGGRWTVGSSLIHSDQGQITGRRIDLIGGRNDFLTAAMPHELTHVILRDRFPDAALPHWADEGTAVLADAAEKQYRHASDLRKALAAQTTFPAAELLAAVDYPGVDRLGTFYGQSASLVKFLIERKGHARFVDFLDHAESHGYDIALASYYAIDGVKELDRQWRSQVAAEQFVDRPQSAGTTQLTAAVAAAE